MGCRDRGCFFAWKEERAAGRVVRDIVELSTMSVEGRKSRVGSGGAGVTDMGLIYAVGGSLC